MIYISGTVKFSFIFFTLIHITKIIIAAIYYDKCPVEPDIPKYLLVMGKLSSSETSPVSTLFQAFSVSPLNLSLCSKTSSSNTQKLGLFCRSLQRPNWPFLQSVSIKQTARTKSPIDFPGSYYVYREYEPSYDPLSGDKYCNKTLYLFSFIYITIVYSLLLLCVVAVGCFVLGVLLVDKYATEKTYDVESTTEVPLPTEQEIKENKQRHTIT